MTEKNTLLNPAGVRELVITRLLDAPCELVFDAWTDPRHTAKWWGPKMFTCPRCEIDPRVGGAILIHMRAPDGNIYPMEGAFTKFQKPGRLAFTNAARMSENSPPVMELLTDVTFENVNGKTKLTVVLTVVHAAAEAAGPLSGAEIGWTQTLDKLDDFIAQLTARPNPGLVDIVVSRTFEAPRELVFKAWTDPAHLMRWFSPNGAATPFASVDFRVGGEFRFCMRFPDGSEAWAKGVYTELVPPERIVYQPYFTDADGNTVSPRHYGIDSERPPGALVTVTFEDLGGKTKLTLRHSVPEFFPARDQMQQGWIEMVNKLGNTF